jgi:nucleoside-diphosphate-sugar epimerase
MKRILLTGATGAVGAELYERLAAAPDVDLHAVSARGDATRGITSWRMGSGPAPEELRRPWDVVVHTAASTRWNMTVDEAVAANRESVYALRDVVGPDTHLVHVSTAYVEGLTGSVESDAIEDYRNTYEWSKAAGERYVRENFAPLSVVRPSLIIGRRTDGRIARYGGPYSLLRGVTSGMLAAVVGDPDTYLDVVPVDEVCDAIMAAAVGPRPAETSTVYVSGGAGSPTLGDVFDISIATLNEWRARRGIGPLEQPPYLEPERWNRFLLPFARQYMSARQLRVVTLLEEFQRYMCTAEPLPSSFPITGLREVVARSVEWWADAYPKVASRVPEPWELAQRFSDGLVETA